uniref:DUF3810 domain-containing protein n=1 Tax=Gelidibacter sp. TaxID=2018083 RepID=UPI00404B7039
MQNYLKPILAFSILIQIALLKLLAQFPQFVESYYSNGVYKGISKLMHYTFGWIPFSMGDVLYTFAGIYVIRWFIIHRKRIVKDTKNWLYEILTAISIGYFAFHILWAFNYYRLPLHQSLQIENDYTTEQLVTFTKALIDRTNAVHRQIAPNDSSKVEMPYSKTELLQMTPKGFEVLSKTYPHLAYHPKSLKRSIYSLPLTYMGFSGYLNPFTNEAQIDGMIPTFKYPTTASHEIAHQLGYAAENEANFIGAMAAISHEDIYFKYSGYAFALNHCLNELFRRNPATYETVIANLNIGILKNYDEVRQFWMSYENPSEAFFKETYSGFLKANNQSAGMDSYSYVVALLVNYNEKHPL